MALVVKNPPRNTGDRRHRCLRRLGRSPGEGNGNPLQFSCLENLKDRAVWRATVCGVTKSRTWLSDWSDLIWSEWVFGRRQWHPTPVFLPGKSHGRRSLVCCDSWGHKESDMTEQLNWPELNWIHLRLWVMILYAHTHITHIGLCIQQTVNKQWLDKGSWESTTIQVLCRCLQGVIGIWKLMKIWYSASKSYLS